VNSLRRRAGPAIAMAVLGVVVWRIGTGPFIVGLEAIDGRALLAAVAIGFVTIVCCAWRWTIVARGLGLRLSLPRWRRTASRKSTWPQPFAFASVIVLSVTA